MEAWCLWYYVMADCKIWEFCACITCSSQYPSQPILDAWPGETAGIVEYVIQHLGSLECAALNSKALELFGKASNALTMWVHANICKLIMGECSEDSTSLLSLLVALGGVKIPVLLFQQLRHEQRQWTEQGEITTISPIQAGIDSYLLHIILEESTLVQLVDKLSPWISIEEAGDSS